jgi:hypothetical protein
VPSTYQKKKKPRCSFYLAHAYNPSCSGDRAARIRSQSQANSSQDSILKKIHHKKGLVEWLKVQVLSSNPNTAGKKILPIYTNWMNTEFLNMLKSP